MQPQVSKKENAFRLIFLPALIALALLGKASANVPKALEPDYCEAILDMNVKNYSQVISKLSRLVSIQYDVPEFHELFALAYKEKKNDEAAIKEYHTLIKLKQKSPNREVEQAPYAFEMGNIYFQHHQNEDARGYFLMSARGRFNEAVSYFYLGMIDFQAGRLGLAAQWFESALASNTQNKEVHVVSKFYLAQIYSQVGYGTGSYRFFKETIRDAQSLAQSSDSKDTQATMNQLITASKASLKGFNQSSFFGSFGLSTAYDSNVMTLPNSVNDLNGSGKGTAKQQASLGLGYTSSPTKNFQTSVNYRTSFAYHSNEKSKQGEFIPHTLLIFLNRKPLESVSWGVKLSGLYLFQNNPKNVNQRIGYEPYQKQVVLGPYIRFDGLQGWMFNAEVGYGRSYFDLDESLTLPSKRSGEIGQWRLSADKNTKHPYLNPSFSLSGQISDTRGTDYRSALATLGVSNSFYVKANQFTASFDYSVTEFYARDPNRDDQTLNYGISFIRPLFPRVMLSADVRYTQNYSTVKELFTFTRFTSSIGLSTSF